MLTFPLWEFTGSFLHKRLTGKTHPIYVNTGLNPGTVICDAYHEPYNPGSTNHPIAVFLSSRDKLNTLFGGDLSSIYIYEFSLPADFKPELPILFPRLQSLSPLEDRMWYNPVNGSILVCFPHWQATHKNGDVTFERTEPSTSDTDITSIRQRYGYYNLHWYDASGRYNEELNLSYVLFLYPGETEVNTDTLKGISSNYYTFFRHWEQEEGQYVIDYYFPGGEHWPVGETHDILCYNTYGDGSNPNMTFGITDLTRVASFLTYSPGFSPSVYWNGDEAHEIFFRGNYHRSGWWYKNGRWEHVWERCPYRETVER